eukprot:TRINITY_DN11857_c0_g1_i1.p1 TRINITY_DN11857_c0_g1~~TRINITY_DN11857_c0_g1_i1.p1  ORF type:complete len:574 (+),score=151.15 TRINITY_DN11857_c0_g1_i1:226-1947(+)
MANTAFNTRVMILLLVLLSSFQQACGGKGLRGQGGAGDEGTDAERRQLVELAGRFTHTDGSSRLRLMEEMLKPMYAALPKDEHGFLSHEVVRYALHRLFIYRRSWYVRGLDPDSERAVRGSEDLLNKKLMSFDLEAIPVLPTLLQRSVEKNHGSVGLSLTETAAVAAAIEDLAHREATNRLSLAYDALGYNKDSELTWDEVEQAINMYFSMYLLGSEMDDWSNKGIVSQYDELLGSGRWDDFQPWLNGIKKTAKEELFRNGGKKVKFHDAGRVVEAVGDSFGEFNSIECRQLKRELMKMESRKPGRVRLSDLYNRSDVSAWVFEEKIDYLRTLGALDETNVSNPQVIITNYVISPPQCLRSSSIYDSCCRNECEDLMYELETKTGAPEASPDVLAKLVAGLTTDTVKARDSLSDAMVERLHWVGNDHGGRVPLHSRKFALWMHHAFPRECPFPHKEGSTSPMTPDEWMKSTGQATQLASTEEKAEYIKPDDVCLADDLDCARQGELPWIDYTDSLAGTMPSLDSGDASELQRTAVLANAFFGCAVLLAAGLLRFRLGKGYASKGQFDLKTKGF